MAKKIVKKEERKKTLSNVVKPVGMTLELWQRNLRTQAAQNEMFSISRDENTDESGCYRVNNYKTQNTYKVIFRGINNRWNFCSCMDFKTNRLGICKHIEAVRLWTEGQKRQIRLEEPAYTAVYLSYQPLRAVCLRIGTDNRAEFQELAAMFFLPDNSLRPECVNTFFDFLEQARAINPSFRCYPDALQFIIEIRERQQRQQCLCKYNTDQALDDLLNTKLFPYQKEGVRFAVKAGKSIIADEMGLGKTIQAIGCAEWLKKENLVSSVLILCPTSLKYQWKKEIERFTQSDVLVIEGGHLQRKTLYKAPQFYKIISYNSAANDLKILGRLHTDMLIMDEAQRLKNWNTQIARAVHRIEADYTVILSGTPLENKLQELYSIVQYVDPYCLGPYYRFVDMTTVLSGTGQIVGYKNLNAVGEQLKDVMLRRRKRDVNLQLPGRTDKTLFVPMTKEQRAIHDECNATVSQIVYKWQRMHFLSETDRKRLLLLLSQMRMVCDSTYILDQRSRYDTKIEELMNMVETMVESGDEKMVVFSQWERMTRLICGELEKRNIGYANLNGSVPSMKRRELMERFTEDPDCRVFVSTDAGSTGLNLQVASIIINMDLPWNPAVLEQRIARAYRIGQLRKVQVINFVAEHTIEERMLSTLNFKSNMAAGILDAGEDAVLLGESKFNRLMETVTDVVDNEPDTASDKIDFEPEPKVVQKEESVSAADPMNEPSDIPTEQAQTPTKEENGQDAPDAVIQKGISFLTQMADILASPEKTETLVNTFVKEDKETGKTSIEIPIPDKESVRRVLGMFSRLLKDSGM